MEANKFAQISMSFKYNMQDYIPKNKFEKILHIDADCIALRNIDHLISGDDWDILIQREPGRSIVNSVFSSHLTHQEINSLSKDGINSGTFAIRGACFQEVMDEWRRLASDVSFDSYYWTEQGAWNRLILDTKLRVKNFEAHEIQFPLHLDKDWLKYEKAALLHAVGGTLEEKVKFLYGMYMQKFSYDPALTLFNMFET
jgi:hypothetical protein